MYHKVWIPFDFGHVAVIVMNAMAIKGEGRKAKECYRVGDEGLGPLYGFRWKLGCDAGSLGDIAVDEVLLFFDHNTLFVRDLVLNRDEYQGARSTLFAPSGDYR